MHACSTCGGAEGFCPMGVGLLTSAAHEVPKPRPKPPLFAGFVVPPKPAPFSIFAPPKPAPLPKPEPLFAPHGPHKIRFWFQGQELVPVGPYKFEQKNKYEVAGFDQPSYLVPVNEYELTCKLATDEGYATHTVTYAECYTEAS